MLSIGSEIFDLIIVDGPPVLGLADALLLSSAASGTLFVVGAGKTRKGLIRGALRRLQLSRGSLIGAVLSGYDAKAVGYGYAGDYGMAMAMAMAHQSNPRGLSVRNAHGREPQPQLTDAHENV